jgi:putative oxidoreductase
MSEIVADRARAFLRFTESCSWLAPLLMRLYFGYFWFETGLGKLHNLAGFTERFVGWGIPFPAFSAALSATTDLIGGALLILGLFTRLATIPMMINLIVATATVAIRPVTDFDSFFELDEVLYIFILFWLFMSGPGRISLDARLLRVLGAGKPA